MRSAVMSGLAVHHQRNHSAGRSTVDHPRSLAKGSGADTVQAGPAPVDGHHPSFLTKEPQPCTISIIPSSSRMASARRAVFRATP